MAKVESWGVSAKSSCQRISLAFQRLAACLLKRWGAMHPQEVREEVGVVAPEVRKEFRVFVESQELTDDLDGEHFGVAERGSGPAPSEAPELFLESVVDEAEEDGDDEGAKIHKEKTSATSVSGAIGSTPSV